MLRLAESSDPGRGSTSSLMFWADRWTRGKIQRLASAGEISHLCPLDEGGEGRRREISFALQACTRNISDLVATEQVSAAIIC